MFNFWEDYAERNYDSDEIQVPKKAGRPKTPNVTHCVDCGNKLTPNDLLAQKSCNACFLKRVLTPKP